MHPDSDPKIYAKISDPLLDRIDLHIEVPAVKYKELASKEAGEYSTSIRERVILAREIQMKRFADLTNAAQIRPEHISEAIQYRSLDRKMWQG